MRRFSWLLAIVLMSAPAFSQDGGGGDFGGGGDGGFFGGDAGAFGAPANAGGNRGQAAPDRLVTLKDMLLKGNAPLSKDQEKALNELLDKEIKAMSAAFTAKFGQEPGAAVAAGARGQGAGAGQARARGQGRGQAAPGAAPDAAGGGGPRAGRGGGGAAGAPGGAAPETPMTVEIRRMNTELLGKVTASLKPEQQAVIKKFENDQIRARGGFEALKLVLEDAGAPALTPEQVPQVQAAYAEETQARAQLLREAAGQPADPAKLSQLQLQTMTKVTKVLTAEQRKALLASMAKPK